MKKSPLPADEPDVNIYVSMLDSCILFCDVIISGKDSAAAIRYDEENMLAPMIVMLEQDVRAAALVNAAGVLGVPVVNNVMLAKNLLSYGKAGEGIPEASYRDVSLAIAKLGPESRGRRTNTFRKIRRSAKVPRPLSIEMGAALFELTNEGAGREKLLAEPLGAMVKKLKKLLGFPVAPFRITHNPRLRSGEYRILFKGLEAGRASLELGWYAGANSDFPRVSFPEMMSKPGNVKAAAKGAASVIVRHAGEIIQRRAHEILGRDEVQAILDTAEEKYPVVTGEVKGLISLGVIREILQGLVSEQVSIRHIAVILETLADWGSYGPSPSEIVIEQIRQSLKRQICLEYADEKLTLRVLTLEEKFEQGLTENFPVREMNKTASNGEEWAEIISRAAKGMEAKGFPPVILCSSKARSQVKEVTRRKLPSLAVLSYMEIPPDIMVEPVGEISFGSRAR